MHGNEREVGVLRSKVAHNLLEARELLALAVHVVLVHLVGETATYLISDLSTPSRLRKVDARGLAHLVWSIATLACNLSSLSILFVVSTIVGVLSVVIAAVVRRYVQQATKEACVRECEERSEAFCFCYDKPKIHTVCICN